MPMPALGLSAALSKNLMEQYLSRHPTGTPFYFENWEYARAWGLLQTGGGSGTYSVVTSKSGVHPSVFNGKAMCKLTSPNVVNGFSRLCYVTGPLPNMRLGMEVNFDLPWNNVAAARAAGLDRFSLGFWVETGSALLKMLFVDYYVGDDILRVWDGAAYHTVLSNVFRQSDGYLIRNDVAVWHNMKLVADFDKDLIETLYFDDRTFTLNIPIVGSTAVYTSRALLNFIQIYQSAAQVSIYLGNVILTTNED